MLVIWISSKTACNSELFKSYYRSKKEVGIEIRLRCLACMLSFLRACNSVPNLKELLKESDYGASGLELMVAIKLYGKLKTKPKQKKLMF